MHMQMAQRKYNSSSLIRSETGRNSSFSKKPNHFDKLNINNAATPTITDSNRTNWHYTNSKTMSNHSVENNINNKNALPTTPLGPNEITTTNISSDTILPLLKYMILSDAVIQEHRKLLSIFIKLLMISSLTALAYGLWIQFTDNKMTFAGFLLRTGTYEAFPMHYAVVINGITGLVCCLVCTISLVRIVHRAVWFIITTCLICGMWTAFTLVYNFGSNIMYEDQLEELMMQELQQSRNSIISPIWRNSQTFFKCCGINSFKDWGYGNRQKSAGVYYPPSCCDHEKIKCGQSPVQESNVWLEGCLESESLQIMIIAYTALLISTLQFLFMTFTLMTLVKVFCRRRCLSKQAIAILAAETVSSTVNATTEDTNNFGLIEGVDNVSDKDVELDEINKSSTV